jgi:hypothetical protein
VSSQACCSLQLLAFGPDSGENIQLLRASEGLLQLMNIRYHAVHAKLIQASGITLWAKLPLGHTIAAAQLCGWNNRITEGMLHTECSAALHTGRLLLHKADQQAACSLLYWRSI